MKVCYVCRVELTDENAYRLKKGPQAGSLLSACKACGKLEHQKWAENNREKTSAYNKTYRLKNPERAKQLGRAWKVRNPEKVAATSRLGSRARRVKFHTRVDLLKSERPCYDCGGTFPPECMDFDHVGGEKLFDISAGINAPWDVLMQEIDKCQLVCACCHRTRTKERQNHAHNFQTPQT